jgi:hypothetical protein
VAIQWLAIQWRPHLRTLPWAGILRRSRGGSPGSPRLSDAPPITRSTSSEGSVRPLASLGARGDDTDPPKAYNPDVSEGGQ